jgi:IclR family mhp operon transcriptional activator
VKSLLRGMEILRLLNRESALTPAEVGRKTGLPRITCYRLLRTLEPAGFVVSDPMRRYRIGPGVLELGSQFARQNWIIEVAAPAMQQAAQTIKWPLIMAANNGPRMTILHSTLEATGFWLRLNGPGTQLPLLGSALGLAYLAFLPQSLQHALIQAAAAVREPGKPSPADNRPRLRRTLEQIRAQGSATLRDSWESESVTLSAIAVPVLRHDEPVAAIGLTFFRSAMTTAVAVHQFGDRLRLLAAAIGAKL